MDLEAEKSITFYYFFNILENVCNGEEEDLR